jgi:hypothetical protein
VEGREGERRKRAKKKVEMRERMKGDTKNNGK